MLTVITFPVPGPVEADIVLTLLEGAWDEGLLDLRGCAAVRRSATSGWQVKTVWNGKPLHPALHRAVLLETAGAWTVTPAGVAARWEAEIAAGGSIVTSLVAPNDVEAFLQIVGREPDEVATSIVDDTDRVVGAWNPPVGRTG